MNCFIDDYNTVLIESNNYIENVNLLEEKLSFIKKEGNKQYFKSGKRIPLHLANEIIVDGNTYLLKIGLVTLRKDFNLTYRYSGMLGNIYSKDKTIFRVFSPVAKAISLVVDNITYEMTYNNPIWEITIHKDLELKKYYYLVNLNGKIEHVSDPYALVYDDYSSVIIDINKTFRQKYDFNQTLTKNMVIYEAHLRDLTSSLDVLDKNNYLGVTKKSNLLNASVLEYIKNLNMTHLQLLPVLDFYEVDIINKDLLYNWGYNPKSYFSLSPWFSSDIFNPYQAINEFKELVDKAHEINLGINLDVVYNHVYKRSLYPFDKLVPGYFYRHDDNFKATNNSLVGNDLETRNYMVRKLIVDSLVYLTKTFKIDGFRFDLMGLMDIDTLLEVEEKLLKINPNIKLYGEGWNIETSVSINKRSNMNNSKYFPNYGHFNDFYRDTLKGNQYNLEQGYLAGNNHKLLEVLLALKGSSNIFKNPLQSINYLDCHDNLTFNDYLILSKIDIKKIKYIQDFGLHVLSISKGIPFFQAGSEFYRSKHLENNTYNKSDYYNQINWDLSSNYLKLKELLNFRKEYNFNDLTYSTKLENNLVRLKLVGAKVSLYIYLKNDFSENILIEENELLFSSYDLNKTSKYVLNYPGIFIFKLK